MSQKQIPTEIAKVYDPLYQHICFLHSGWGLFCELFAKDRETVDMLNWTASGFFYFFQKMIVDDVLLSLCRITDPEKTRRWENLSLARLVNSVDESTYPQLRDELNRLLKRADKACGFARDIRDKKIAHNDLVLHNNGAATIVDMGLKQQIDKALEAVRDVANKVEAYFRDTPVSYEELILSDDAALLLSRLKQLKEFSKR